MISHQHRQIQCFESERQETLISCLRTAIARQAGMYIVKSADMDEFCSYETLLCNATSIAKRLHEIGVVAGDPVIIQIDITRSYLSAFWACLLGGFLAVPLACGPKDEQLNRVFQVWRRLRTPWLISTLSHVDRLAAFWGTQQEDAGLLRARSLLLNISNDHELPLLASERLSSEASPRPGDVAFIQFSSGSTGSPKGVMLTHGQVLANCKAFIERAQVNDRDVPLGWMPLTHDMGLIGTHLGSIVAGLSPILMPTPMFVRRPLLWLQKAHKHRATILSSPNFGLQYTLAALRAVEPELDWDLSAVRLIWNGAEPVSQETCSEFEAKFARFGLQPRVMYPCYGLAEGTVAVTLQNPGEAVYVHRLRRDSLRIGHEVEPATAREVSVSFSECGYPLPCCEVSITSQDGKPLPAKHVGHVLIRGASVTSGYYREDRQSAQARQTSEWLDTGDLGFLTETGRLVLTGRGNEMIVLNGFNLYPHDVERLIEKVEGVTTGQVAVCAVNSRSPIAARTALAAFVVYRRSGDQFHDIASAVRRNVMDAAGIQLDYVVPVMRLPRTTSGKIRRFELAAAFNDRLLDAPSPAIGAFQNDPVSV